MNLFFRISISPGKAILPRKRYASKDAGATFLWCSGMAPSINQIDKANKPI
jgi:hypothetical protein